MKTLTRTFSSMALVVCLALLALTANAQKPSSKNASKPSGERKAIGYCDTLKGCKSLKAACESKQVGGTYKPANPEGTKGVCETSASQETFPGSANLAAGSKDTRDSKCFSTALCEMLSKTCKGTFTKPNSNVPYGTCSDE